MTTLSDRPFIDPTASATDRLQEALLRHAPDLVLEISERGIEYISPNVREILGLDPASLLGRAADELIHPDDRAGLEGLLRGVAAGMGRGAIRRRLLHARGHGVWFEATISPFLTVDGALHGVVIARQLDDRVAEERELDTLRTMVDSLPSPILVVASSHVVFASNSAWRASQSGAPAPEGKAYSAVAAAFCSEADPAARLTSLVDEALAGGSPQAILVRCVTDGVARWWQVSARFVGRGRFATVVHEDVTALVSAEREQRAQQTVLERAQRIGRMGHWEFSRETGVGRASAQTLEILGVTEEAVADFEALLNLVPEDEREEVRAGIRAARDGQPGRSLRHRIIRPDGGIRWVDHTFDVRTAAASDDPILMGVIQDVTDQVAATEALRTNREALRESNARRHEALRLARAALWRSDSATGQISWSPEATEIFGDDLGSTSTEVAERQHPDDALRVARVFTDGGRTGEAFAVRYRIRIAGGDYRWVENRVVPEVDKDDVLVGYRGIMQDIQGQVDREAALRDSDDRQREALRIARAAIWTWDRRTRHVWQSNDLYEILGFETMPETFEDRVAQRHPDDRVASIEFVNDAIRRRQPFTVRYRIARPTGDWMWIEERGVPEFDASGGLTGYRGTRQDVDAQVRREEALRESDDRQREALQIARADIWTWDRATGVLETSPDLLRHFGYETVPTTREELLAIRHPDDREWPDRETADAIRARRQYTMRYRVARADASWAWVEVRGIPQFDASGELTGYRGTRQDVDEQVRREDALRESDDRQHEALKIARAANWTWDHQTKALWQSPDLYTLLGYDSVPETFEGRVGLRHPDDQERSRLAAEDAIRKRESFVVRYRIARPDGGWAWVEQRGAPQYSPTGEYVGFRGTRQDVDEQVRREEALRESDERQREALRIARASVWTYDAATHEDTMSADVFEHLGYDQMPDGDGRAALRHPDDRERSLEEAFAHMRARHTYSTRYRMRRADGSWAWVESRGAPQFDAHGEYAGYRGTVQDVHEQVEREEELREALTIARAGFWRRSRLDATPWWSPELYDMIGLPVTEMPPPDAAQRHPDDQSRVDHITNEAVRTHRPYTVRYRVRHHRTGEWVWVELRGVPVFAADGAAIAYRGVIRDISEEMERQTELRRSEALLKQAERLTRVGSYAANIETAEQHWSDEQFRLLGYEPDQVTATADLFYDRVHPEDRAMVRESFRAVIKTGEPIVRQYRIVLPDGTVRTLNGAAELRRDAQGRPTEIIGATQDVTERIEAETRLRRSEARLRGVLDSAGDGITLHTRDGRTEWTNAAFQRMVGYAAEELAGMDANSIFDAGATRVTSTWWRSVTARKDSGLPHSHKLRLRRKDGTFLTAESTPSALRDGDEVIGMLSVIRDTTERDHLQAQVEAATREIEQILQTTPLPIILIEEDGTIRLANRRTMDTFGWAPEELVGQDVSVLAGGLDPGVHREHIRAYQETGAPAIAHALMVDRTLEVTARRRDGTEFPAEVSVTEMADAEGRRRFLGVVTDLTERKRAEEELTRMQKTEALGTLVAGVAHDFNNLLTAMVGGIAMAQEQPDDARWLGIAQEAAQRATRLVQQLLQFSRRSRPELQDVDPATLVERTTAIIRETIDRRIAVEVEVAAVEGTLAGDEGQLQQVVMNLLVNSRDAVLERADAEGPGYSPHIRIAVHPDHLRDQHAVRIEVADNGAGMTPAVRARAFDPFFTTKPVGRGTGLGLATVAGIIERHDGEIGLESAVGAGTTVTVRLPLVTPSDTGIVRGDHAVSVPAVTRTAIVIDDEEMVRAVSTAYLEAAHYHVIPLQDGNEAIRLVESGADIDVILTDVNMPSPNGWEILARLRGRDGVPPIVVASGYADAETARERGAAGFLHKPFSQGALLRVIEEALRQQ